MDRALPVRCTRDLCPVELALRCNWCIAVAGASMICSMVLLPLLSFVGSELLSLVRLPYEMDLRYVRAVMPSWPQGIVASGFAASADFSWLHVGCGGLGRHCGMVAWGAWTGWGWGGLIDINYLGDFALLRGRLCIKGAAL